MRIRDRQPLLVAAVVAVVVLAIGVAQTAAGKSVLSQAGLTGGEDRYTELAFARPTAVPDYVSDKPADLELPFAIRNAEGERRDYRWSLVVVSRRGTKTLDRGRLTLAAGASGTVGQRVKLRCAGDRVRVEVRLERPRQSIGAWIRCPGTPPEASRNG
jgi:hypothetical protein